MVAGLGFGLFNPLVPLWCGGGFWVISPLTTREGTRTTQQTTEGPENQNVGV